MEREAAKNFQELIVWKKAHQFVLSVYKFSNDFPKSEIYGLISQIRRAAVSVPANIAEGFKKKTKPDKANYLNETFEKLAILLILWFLWIFSEKLRENFQQMSMCRDVFECHRV